MARIFYSMSGEGRGHATRARAIIDYLCKNHEVYVFAPGDAFELLAPAYKDSAVKVLRIPGLHFYYTKSGKLNTLETGRAALQYLGNLPRLLRKFDRFFEKKRPDLIVVDFEPALPRAANRNKIPFISLNHQHFLVVNDLSELPFRLRLHALFMGLVVRLYHRGEVKNIVSSFYFPPLKKTNRNVTQVGVILRPSILAANPVVKEHLVVYLRKFAPDNVLKALEETGRPVFVYGLGERPDRGKVIFKPVSEESFLEDLSSCTALICTAGNQLVGEAHFLGKPVFAMPEQNNQEQYINAWFLENEGTGTWCDIEDFNIERLNKFLRDIEQYIDRIVPEKFNGNSLAIQAVEDALLEHS